MIHFSKLGCYAKIDSDENKDMKYYFKLIDVNCYDVSFLFGKHYIQRYLADEDKLLFLIDSCFEQGFEKLNKIDLDNHNKNRWGELTLLNYNKILPEINNKSVKKKI